MCTKQSENYANDQTKQILQLTHKTVTKLPKLPLILQLVTPINRSDNLPKYQRYKCKRYHMRRK